MDKSVILIRQVWVDNDSSNLNMDVNGQTSHSGGVRCQTTLADCLSPPQLN